MITNAAISKERLRLRKRGTRTTYVSLSGRKRPKTVVLEIIDTVFLLDDEPTVRMLVAEVLSDLGYNALEAEDGASGLKVLNSDGRIDLLVTDVGLPGGLNGRQVADAGRSVRPGLKVLFIRGYAENAVLSHGHLDPGMHVMTKPFAMDALERFLISLHRNQRLRNSSSIPEASRCRRYGRWHPRGRGWSARPLFADAPSAWRRPSRWG
jgi:CheY-like chemotaxis protein